jgi:hypothetical protein
MPADGVHDISLSQVTPVGGKGALGIWRALPNQPVKGRSSIPRSRPAGQLALRGVYRRQHLSFSDVGKASGE